MFIDSHAHLQDKRLEAQLESVLVRAKESRVTYIVSNAISEADWPKLSELEHKHQAILACYGIHPWFVHERSPDWLPKLETILRNSRSGVGEIGLDFRKTKANKDEQVEVFRTQLGLAATYHRPAMIHCLSAFKELRESLQALYPLPCGFLLHGYGGSAELVPELLNLGAYFSFSGSVLKGDRNAAKKALQAVPLERLLVETDSPDMLPPLEFRHTLSSAQAPEFNEPCHLGRILYGIAAIRGEDVEEVASCIYENSMRFFSKLLPETTA